VKFFPLNGTFLCAFHSKNVKLIKEIVFVKFKGMFGAMKFMCLAGKAEIYLAAVCRKP
jgi:hypothetical protein